jgi:seryl-tRNA synthetase
MSRRDLEKSGYLNSFPNLLGCVSALHGGDEEIRAAVQRHESGGSWTTSLSATELVLSPAACYPVYPLAASRGFLPRNGWLFDVACDCFRHEPSLHLDRLQSFRMREYVCIGHPDEVVKFRTRWIDRGQQIADRLGLSSSIAPASDPFFGREGKMMAVSQVQQALKFELLVPIDSAASPTACMSFNYHRDHFGTTWNLYDEAGATAHTACVAFGMDRLAVAMFTTHGIDTAVWPTRVRDALRL